MAISTAVQRGKLVYVYNENGNNTITIQGDLQGFTSSTVTVRRGNMVYVYELNSSRRSARVAHSYSC